MFPEVGKDAGAVLRELLKRYVMKDAKVTDAHSLWTPIYMG